MDHKDTFSDVNRKYFNAAASNVFGPNGPQWIQDLLKQTSGELQKHAEWMGLKLQDGDKTKPVRMLDYACGNGIASRTLLPYISSAVGIDVAENMVDLYNSAASSLSLPPTKMSATRGDLLADPPDTAVSGPEFHDFDIAVISMALHHVDKADTLVQRLVQRLKTGGVLVVIEGLKRDEWDVGDVTDVTRPGHTVARHGFGRDELEEMVREAGCEEVESLLFEKMSRVGDGGAEMQGFLTRGRKID